MDVCPICERIIPDAATACPHCAAASAAVAGVPPAVQSPAKPGGPGRREVMIIAAAVIGSGVITLAMLGSRGDATATASPVTSGVGATPAGRAPEATPVSAPGWTENRVLWTGNNRKSVALELAARNETQVWMKSVRPTLVLRCIANRQEVFVFTDSAAAMEAQDEDHTVRIGFDGAAARTERWPDSVEHDALFAPDGAALAREVAQARTMQFEYTPHNAAAVVAHFDVAGLADKVALDAAPCAAAK